MWHYIEPVTSESVSHLPATATVTRQLHTSRVLVASVPLAARGSVSTATEQPATVPQPHRHWRVRSTVSPHFPTEVECDPSLSSLLEVEFRLVSRLGVYSSETRPLTEWSLSEEPRLCPSLDPASWWQCLVPHHIRHPTSLRRSLRPRTVRPRVCCAQCGPLRLPCLAGGPTPSLDTPAGARGHGPRCHLLRWQLRWRDPAS